MSNKKTHNTFNKDREKDTLVFDKENVPVKSKLSETDRLGKFSSLVDTDKVKDKDKIIDNKFELKETLNAKRQMIKSEQSSK